MKKYNLESQQKKADDIYPIALKSGYEHVQLRLQCVRMGLIKPTDTKDRRNIARDENMSLKEVEIRFLENCEKYSAARPDIEVLSNSARSAQKATVTLDGHHLNPLQQAKDSSYRIVQYMRKVSEMEDLFYLANREDFGSDAYRYDGGTLYSYSFALTMRNSDKGELNQEVSDLNAFVTKLNKRLKDSYRNDYKKNRLTAVDGSRACPVGMLISNELTVNDEQMNAMDSYKLFHPHIHGVLFTDKELNKNIAEDIYAIWDEITDNKTRGKSTSNRSYSTNRAGFSFSLAYNPLPSIDGSEDEKKRGVIETVKEATKYLLDPEKWSVMALDKSDTDAMKQFKSEVFAEYFNAYAGLQRMRTYGLLKDATTFVNRFSAFEKAMTMSDGDVLPDILTQLNTLVFNSKKDRYELKHDRNLTNDEIIYENRTYLSNMLVSDEFKNDLNNFIEEALEDIENPKDRLFAVHFRNKVFNSSIDDLFDSIDEELAVIRGKFHIVKKEVFDKKQYEDDFGKEFEIGDYKHFTNYCKMLDSHMDSFKDDLSGDFYKDEGNFRRSLGRACDLELLKTAISKTLNVAKTEAELDLKLVEERTFRARNIYRDIVRASSDQHDIPFNGLFYRLNGMSITMMDDNVPYFVSEDKFSSYEDLRDLFRVPENIPAIAGMSSEESFWKDLVFQMKYDSGQGSDDYTLVIEGGGLVKVR